jgi:hypothetical protein
MLVQSSSHFDPKQTLRVGSVVAVISSERRVGQSGFAEKFSKKE